MPLPLVDRVTARSAFMRFMISEGIACPEAGYPLCEARYVRIEDWEYNNRDKSFTKAFVDFLENE